MSDTTENESKPLIAGVLLAAGASSRLGQPKQLVTFRGVPLVYRAATLALGFCDAGVTVVTGACHDEVVMALDDLPVTVIFSPGWHEGIGSSIRQGVTAVSSDVAAILLMVCDQPEVDPEDLGKLVAAWKRMPDRVAAAGYSGTRGVPAIFPVSMRGELQSLSSDRGAKIIIDAASEVSVVEMPSATFDIDTPDHLDRLKE